MITGASRRAACEFTIVLMACGAAHHFAIAPTELRAARIAAEAARLSDKDGAAPSLTAEQLRSLAQRAEVIVERTRTRSRMTDCPTELLSELTALSESFGVHLERLEPGEPQDDPPGAPPSPLPTDAPVRMAPARARVLNTSMIVSGSYGDVSRFLDKLTARAGYTVVASASIRPTPQRGKVAARIEARHYSFAAMVASVSPPPGAGGER
ncbi:MAG: hypothetical protein ACK4WH_03465 [Phycisphaerales bacterium]